jgi:hypothetical protein
MSLTLFITLSWSYTNGPDIHLIPKCERLGASAGVSTSLLFGESYASISPVHNLSIYAHNEHVQYVLLYN